MLIHDLGLPDLERFFEELGEPKYRAAQVWQGMYQHFLDDASGYSNLPASLKRRLAETFDFAPLQPTLSQISSDRQTRKVLFDLKDGSRIETVLMNYDPVTFSGRKRRTLCISTQAGCAMGCTFCATGQMGFSRNLTVGEIVSQVLFFARELKPAGEKVTHVVFMGMGEPFHNYLNTVQAIDRLNDAEGFNLGARRITVSTVGLVPQIRRFADEGRQVNLAISLHASNDEDRNELMPVNRRYNIHSVLDACRYYIAKTNRRITFEWALIHNRNDTREAAGFLATCLKGMLCHVNAIPLNPTAGFEGKAATRERARAFKEVLEQAGIPCTIRLRRGIDIHAGCGQLAGARM
ncbi:MAG: 23S rRNA (adenine(2503)-C(2))-methyltransferase RlmN [Chloroflexi bacterium]|nr:23S rRNA (adenine(2503)-C(2))-methyltransferase RlmN [Chloroflexota bacterium]